MTLWSVGVYDLRLSDEEFWGMSPRQFTALYRRHSYAQDVANRRAGVIAATIANVNRSAKKRSKAYGPDDFFSSPNIPKRHQSWQEQLSIVEMLNVAFGGNDARRLD